MKFFWVLIALGLVFCETTRAETTPATALSRQMVFTNSLLNIPVKTGAPRHRMTILAGTNVVWDFNVELATSTPDWWAFLDVSPLLGRTATVTVDNLPANSPVLNSLVQSNGIVGANELYREHLRPQLHFSSRRGWLNDPNGMIYYQGKYHLYYQHDPFGWNGTDQKFWGHAVSTDMLHWQELPEAVYPHSYGDWVWSGTAVVDWANTSGLKTGANELVAAAFYSTKRSECLAFSNDGGLTFTDYSNNPIVVNTGRDPHLLWYAPSNCWVMAVYDGTGKNGISFYSSPNLRQWTYHSKLDGFYECPDLFQIPVEGRPNETRWVLYDASSGYMLGRFDGAVFTPETPKLPGNKGSGFYAAQTFTEMPAGDSRRVRIGWAVINMPAMPFNQMMYFPTELTLRPLPEGLRLCSQPVREIQRLHDKEYSWSNLELKPGNNPFSHIRATLLHLKTRFTPGLAQTIQFTFQDVKVIYDAPSQQISCNGLTNALPTKDGVIQLEMLVDRDSLEIFGNDGELYMPMPVSNPSSSSLVSVSCTGGPARFHTLTLAKLKSIWESASPR